MRIRLLALVVLLPLVAACGEEPAPTSTDGDLRDTSGGGGTEPADPLEGRDFLATGVTEGGTDRPLASGTEIRLGFTKGRITIDAGCNGMGGRYSLDGPTLVVAALDTTEIGCDQARMDQDTWVAELVTSRPDLTLAGDSLTLTAGDTVITLTDREVARPGSPLVGTTWTLESLIDGDVASSVPVGVTATMTFDADGTYAVSAGCNRGGGRYEINGAMIDFDAPATTRMSCGDDSDGVERSVLDVLSGPVRFVIDEQSLTLTKGAAGLGLRA